MHSLRSYVIVALVAGWSVNAAPAANGCSPIDAVYAILRGPLQAQASSLCLSYLGGDKTVQQTQTTTITGAGATTTTTAAPLTETTTSVTTNTNTITRTERVQLSDVVVTTTVTVTAGTRTVYQKRETLAGRAVPAPLASFAASRVSSACRCIVTPVTRTVTTTQTQSVAGPQVTETQPGGTVILITTTIIQVTTETTVTTTDNPTTTVTSTFATTVTPILVKPKICNARGLPGANAFNYDANFNTNQAACIASCKTDNRCLATGFYVVTDISTGTTTGTCRKYDKSVTDSADLGFGYYNFNDKAC